MLFYFDHQRYYLIFQGTSSDISSPGFKWKIRISHWFAYLDLMNENIKNESSTQKNTFQTPKEVDVTFLLAVFILFFKISDKQ